MALLLKLWEKYSRYSCINNFSRNCSVELLYISITTYIRTCTYTHKRAHTQFEADRRAFIITINSFGTELTMDDREKLYPSCGRLYPEGLTRLAKCEDYDQVKAVADCYPVSLSLSLSLFRYIHISLDS